MRKFKVHLEDNEFEGTGKEIIEFVKTKSFVDKSHLDLKEWVKELQQNVWRLYGIGVHVDDKLPIDEQCEILVEQLIDKRLIVEIK